MPRLDRETLHPLSAVADQSKEITVTVYVRPNPHAEQRPALDDYALALPGQRRQYTDAEIEQMYGASPADLDAVEKFATASKLKVLNRSVAKRSVLLQGTIANISRAFGVNLGVSPAFCEISHSETTVGIAPELDGMLRRGWAVQTA